MTIQKYDWVSKDTKLNANGWSVPLKSNFFKSKYLLWICCLCSNSNITTFKTYIL